MKLYDLFENDNSVDIELDEVSMSPTSLTSFSKTSVAQSMTIGFEAEIIISGLSDEEDMDIDPEPDYSMDEEIPYRSIYSRIERFFLGGDSPHSRGDVAAAIDEFMDDYHEYVEKKFLETVQKNKQELFDRIKDENEDLTDEEVDDSIYKKDSIYHDAVDDWRDDFMNDDPEDLFEKFRYSIGVTHMRDFSLKYNLHWPYYNYPQTRRGDENGITFADLADSFSQYSGYTAVASSTYHGSKRISDTWAFESDGSIKPDDPDREGGIEVISPPMPFEKGWEALDVFYSWAKKKKAYTNDSCGFHVGVSMPPEMQQNLDPIKLIILLGDQKVLTDFGRAENSFTASSFAKVKKNILMLGQREIKDLKADIGKDSANIARKLMTHSIDRYVSVNVRENYVEFRSMGGENYLEKWETIKNTILRYMRALSLACDPSAARQEYLKKLAKLMSAPYQKETPEYYFARYVAGVISKDELMVNLHNLFPEHRPQPKERLPQ